MIFGIGTDIVSYSRIHDMHEHYGERLARRLLSDAELAEYATSFDPARFLMRRFAAKEAFSKALGTGIRAPANWHGVWVINHRSGKPQLEFSVELAALLRSRGILRSHLTLTDERGMAAATVILECDG